MSQDPAKSSSEEILKEIAFIREQKGREKETLQLIQNTLGHEHDVIVKLLFEEALTYQHLMRNEEYKNENADDALRRENIYKMKEVVMEAKYYIVRFDLDRWKSKMYVFLGKVDDFQEKYESAERNYRRAIMWSRTDPGYLEGVPVKLEIYGHLSFSMIKSGHVQEGYELALKTYKDFDKDKAALKLKKNNYHTWAVWKSGVAMRNIRALLQSRTDIGKADFKDWLEDVRSILKPESTFSYRIGELHALEKILGI